MKETYRFDMHVHTSETSGCGQVPGGETARLYHQAGYQGIMVTDHFHKEYFDSLGPVDDCQKIGQYLAGYEAAKAEGDRIGLDVVLGMEFRNTETDNDFLIVGVTEEFLYQHPRIYEQPLDQAIRLFHRHDMLVIQAHPLRFAWMERRNGRFVRPYQSQEMIDRKRKNPEAVSISQNQWKRLSETGMTGTLPDQFVLRVCEPLWEDLLDGIEIYNGNSGWAQDPDEVDALLSRHPDYLQISASDFHERAHLARGGLILDRRVTCGEELKAACKTGAIQGWIRHE